VDAYTLIGRVDDEGYDRLSSHDGIRYVARTVGSFSAFAAYEVGDVEELGRMGRVLDELAQGSLRTFVSTGPTYATSASPPDIPTECINTATLKIDWDCVGYQPPMPSHGVKPEAVAFAVCRTRRGAAGDGDLALRSSAAVRAYCELHEPGSWLAELGTDDTDDLVWAVDQLARNDVFVRVRSGVVVRGRRRLTSD
jgi:hypothetical protein